jgi:hypothetical protein
MNILPRNPADHEAKSPRDKNIRFPVCVPAHDSLNGTTGTFLTIVVYDKHKTTLVDDPSDLINTRRSTCVIRSLGSSTRAVFLLYCTVWFMHPKKRTHGIICKEYRNLPIPQVSNLQFVLKWLRKEKTLILSLTIFVWSFPISSSLSLMICQWKICCF